MAPALTGRLAVAALRLAMVGLGGPLTFGSQDLDVGGFLQTQFRTALALCFAWTGLMFVGGCFAALVVLVGLAFGWNAPNSVVYVLLVPSWFAVAGLCLNTVRGVACDVMRRFSRWRPAWESPDYRPSPGARILLMPTDFDLPVQAVAAVAITLTYLGALP